jgi:hypothetical protein
VTYAGWRRHLGGGEVIGARIAAIVRLAAIGIETAAWRLWLAIWPGAISLAGCRRRLRLAEASRSYRLALAAAKLNGSIGCEKRCRWLAAAANG